MKNGFTFQFNHTWSKMMEATTFLNDADPLPYEMISDLDRTHRFALSGIYELPFGPGKPFLNNTNPFLKQAFGGWQVQAVWQANTGQPIGFGNSLLLSNQVALSRSEQTLDRWFKTEAFNRAPAQQLQFNLLTLSPRFSGIRARRRRLGYLGSQELRHHREMETPIPRRISECVEPFQSGGSQHGADQHSFGQITAINGFPRYIHFGLKLIY